MNFDSARREYVRATACTHLSVHTEAVKSSLLHHRFNPTRTHSRHSWHGVRAIHVRACIPPNPFFLRGEHDTARNLVGNATVAARCTKRRANRGKRWNPPRTAVHIRAPANGDRVFVCIYMCVCVPCDTCVCVCVCVCGVCRISPPFTERMYKHGKVCTRRIGQRCRNTRRRLYPRFKPPTRTTCFCALQMLRYRAALIDGMGVASCHPCETGSRSELPHRGHPWRRRRFSTHP